eukprot:3502804-Pyramimonas_sp.AAC.1
MAPGTRQRRRRWAAATAELLLRRRIAPRAASTASASGRSSNCQCAVQWFSSVQFSAAQWYRSRTSDDRRKTP